MLAAEEAAHHDVGLVAGGRVKQGVDVTLQRQPSAHAGGQVQLAHHASVLLQHLLVCCRLQAAADQIQIGVNYLLTKPPSVCKV